MKYLILITAIISLSSSCVKDPSKCPDKFIIPAEIIPYSDTYEIGDTILMISSFDKFVFDQQTNKKYNMENISWNPILGIHKLDTNIVDPNNIQTVMHNYVNFIPDEKYNLHFFYFSSGGSSLFGKYEFLNDTFTMEIKIIPKLKGTFFLKFGSGLVMSDQEFEGKCRHIGFDVYTDMNGDKDNNIDLLRESPNPHYNDWLLQKPEQRFDRGGGYCFRVVE